jgi:hypothetical protein
MNMGDICRRGKLCRIAATIEIVRVETYRDLFQVVGQWPGCNLVERGEQIEDLSNLLDKRLSDNSDSREGQGAGGGD